MSMPLTVTSVRLCVRCGRASPTIIRTPARIGSSHIHPADPAAAAAGDFSRQTDVGIFDGGDGTSPPAPQHHQRQQRQQPEPLRLKEASHAPSIVAGGCLRADLCVSSAGRCAHEIARAVVQRIHVLQGERHAREFDEIALMEKFRQQRAMARQRGVWGFEQIAQKFFRGSMGGGEVGILARCSRGRCRIPRWRTRARSAGCISARMSSRRCSAASNGSRHSWALPAAAPAPSAITAERERGPPGQQRRQQPAGTENCGPRISRMSSGIADAQADAAAPVPAGGGGRRP